MRLVPRENFLWSKEQSVSAYEDEPIPLGNTGQTISAPHMIVTMLEELDLSRSQRVLEVGGGSGYNAALIAQIVGDGLEPSECPVISIERDPALAQFARRNLESLRMEKMVCVVEGDGSLGYPQESNGERYDRIIVAAGAPHIPSFLKKQLKVGGILLVPVGFPGFQRLMKIRKESDETQPGKRRFKEESLMGCSFVPLIGSDAHYF